MRHGFGGCHPAVNMLFFLSVFVFGMLFYHPVLLGTAFLAALGSSLVLNARKTARLLLRFLLPTLLFVTLLNTAFNHYGVTTLFLLPGGNRVTLEAVLHGLATGGMVVTVFLWFTCYEKIVTTDKFLHVVGRRLPTAALLLSMTLRFLPLFTKRLHKIEQAQRGIGGKRGGIHALSILVTWSLENAVEIADSMKSRGYGLRGRTHYARFRWTVRDVLLFVLILLLDALVLCGVAAGQTRANYNPYFAIPPQTSFSAVLYAGYAALCFLPLFLQLPEVRRWNRSV